ncbi:hypothetical protein Tco_1550280, partial [Tanacetum coccineum]
YRLHVILWPSDRHAHTFMDHDSKHQSCRSCVVAEQSFEVNPFFAADPEPFVNVFAPDSNSEASSSGEPLENSLLKMLCGASTTQYCPKSNRKTSILLLLKTSGFKPCKMKSMNLID